MKIAHPFLAYREVTKMLVTFRIGSFYFYSCILFFSLVISYANNR